MRDTHERKGTRTSVALLLLAPALAYGASPGQRTFSSPDEAATALVAAAKADDMKALTEILGPEAKHVLSSGDAVADNEARENFVETYEQAHEIVNEGDAKAIVQTGSDRWPLPIPLVKTDAGWRFDSAAGADELINRRIGRNELSTIQACLAVVDAQREYYERNPEGGVRHYAARIASNKGKRDGLYWETTEDQVESPLGPLFASARAEGYGGKGKGAPYHGYVYRLLTAQGPDAAGGAYEYMGKGKLIGGFALVASPAEYGVSGVMTFLANHDGVVFEKDLGPKTAATVAAMKTFNPDATWKRVTETEEAKAD